MTDDSDGEEGGTSLPLAVVRVEAVCRRLKTRLAWIDSSAYPLLAFGFQTRPDAALILMRLRPSQPRDAALRRISGTLYRLKLAPAELIAAPIRLADEALARTQPARRRRPVSIASTLSLFEGKRHEPNTRPYIKRTNPAATATGWQELQAATTARSAA